MTSVTQNCKCASYNNKNIELDSGQSGLLKFSQMYSLTIAHPYKQNS